jgi:hypothetical protein
MFQRYVLPPSSGSTIILHGQYIPEDKSELHTRNRENLKSHKCLTCIILPSKLNQRLTWSLQTDEVLPHCAHVVSSVWRIQNISSIFDHIRHKRHSRCRIIPPTWHNNAGYNWIQALRCTVSLFLWTCTITRFLPLFWKFSLIPFSSCYLLFVCVLWIYVLNRTVISPEQCSRRTFSYS